MADKPIFRTIEVHGETRPGVTVTSFHSFPLGATLGEHSKLCDAAFLAFAHPRLVATFMPGCGPADVGL